MLEGKDTGSTTVAEYISSLPARSQFGVACSVGHSGHREISSHDGHPRKNRKVLQLVFVVKCAEPNLIWQR